MVVHPSVDQLVMAPFFDEKDEGTACWKLAATQLCVFVILDLQVTNVTSVKLKDMGMNVNSSAQIVEIMDHVQELLLERNVLVMTTGEVNVAGNVPKTGTVLHVARCVCFAAAMLNVWTA